MEMFQLTVPAMNEDLLALEQQWMTSESLLQEAPTITNNVEFERGIELVPERIPEMRCLEAAMGLQLPGSSSTSTQQQWDIIQLVLKGFPEDVATDALNNCGSYSTALAYLFKQDQLTATSSGTVALIHAEIFNTPSDRTVLDELKAHGLEWMYSTAEQGARGFLSSTPSTTLTLTEATAVYLYTMNGLYKLINQLLRNQDLSHISTWRIYLRHLMNGLSKKEIFWGETYRGLDLSALDPSTLKVGSFVHWSAFTSSSKKTSVAAGWSGGGILFTIKSTRGRAIWNLSHYESEQEVLYTSGSYFKILQTQEVSSSSWKVDLEEVIHPGDAKVCLWVDDLPENNESIIKDCFLNGIDAIPVLDTAAACQFLDKHPHLLRRDSDSFRIITDMHRLETDPVTMSVVPRPTAGMELINILSEKYSFSGAVICYTSSDNVTKYGKEVEDKFHGVEIISNTSKLIDFANFKSPYYSSSFDVACQPSIALSCDNTRAKHAQDEHPVVYISKPINIERYILSIKIISSCNRLWLGIRRKSTKVGITAATAAVGVSSKCDVNVVRNGTRDASPIVHGPKRISAGDSLTIVFSFAKKYLVVILNDCYYTHMSGLNLPPKVTQLFPFVCLAPGGEVQLLPA
jgi:hypothetical protein